MISAPGDERWKRRAGAARGCGELILKGFLLHYNYTCKKTVSGKIA